MNEEKDDDCEDESGLRDGRCEGESGTKFTQGEWIQIACEALILFAFVLGGVYVLSRILWCVGTLESDAGTASGNAFCSAEQAPLVMSTAFFLSGLIGGAVFSLKWLYHTVAKNIWHRDRLLWRVTVPLMGAILGVFITYIFARTFGTSFRPESLSAGSLLPACGFSFLVGVFADGALASLERLARSIFGTLENFNGTK